MDRLFPPMISADRDISALYDILKVEYGGEEATQKPVLVSLVVFFKPYLNHPPIDLCLAAGLPPVALLCELVDASDEKGGIAARDACFEFAKQHDLKVITIEDLLGWRQQHEKGQNVPQNSSGVSLDEERGVQLAQQTVVGPSAES